MISDASRAERASSSRVNMKGGAHHQDEENADVLEVHGPEVADVRHKRWQQATELEKSGVQPDMYVHMAEANVAKCFVCAL